MSPTGQPAPLINQPKRNPLMTVAKVMVPVLVLAGGLAAVWFMVPSARQMALSWISPAPTVEAPAGEAPATSAPTGQAPAEKLTDDEIRFRDINLMRVALADYYVSRGRYPATLNDLVPKHLAQVPRDPNGGAYRYALTETGYTVTFTLEDGLKNLSAGPHSLTPRGIDQQPTADPSDDGDSDTNGTADDGNGLEPATVAPTPPVPPVDPTLDTDSDKLTDLFEKQVGTDPTKPDTDGDGLTDSEEVNLYGTNPLLKDSDGDGHADKAELDSGFDPTRPGAKLADTDNDGLYDLIEITRSYNPNDPDTDGDGLADGDEANAYGTSPVLKDTDGDGFSDGAEVAGGYNPLGEGMASTERQNEWQAAEAQHGLHEPTLTTLGR